MKCPHCGIEVRDTTVICGYCGGKIPQKKGTMASQKGGRADTAGIVPKKAPPAKKSRDEEPGSDDEEEEGGLSSLLQPNEQVLIGSLNVSVKKFLFHAYLTDQRIFLLDTHEKKLKVTAKDIPLDTITESTVEFSDTSDPVLVLSIRAPDDDIKTMKLVFSQDGLDRSDEVDEWIALLTEKSRPKKPKKPAAKKAPFPEPEPEVEGGEEPGEEEPAGSQVTQSPMRPELHPAKRPTKDPEKQPPVKRLVSLYTVSKEEIQETPTIRPEGKPSEQPAKKISARPPSYREIPPTTKPETQPMKRVEVQSAMKTAMKTAMQPVQQPSAQPLKRPAPELRKKPMPEPEVPPAEVYRKEPEKKEEIPEEEEGGSPVFCQKCGKKLPAAANFCPGCGTKLSQPRVSVEPAPTHVRKSQKSDGTKAEDKGVHPPVKPAGKKTPKGSEMTLLHKFLRR
ncbi:MAG: zinc-ribbon domain-containing protein [Methanoregula sp.]|nr:zinc-ribbon domain-containing protein [Methanoregula sp.]